ncbi:glycosyltransferase family 2 protein [Thiorhodococcus drewsii]|uniref:glycosyltransferase family 2 protein n=1 Tax=Thiorhodococcus drewsii TaxID=210408 RepID=UPI000680321D|nr:glycosyltransferase family A protein [Thiorhodococcus drewsii]
MLALSPYFDAAYYLARYSDVARHPQWAKHPALHYLLYGGLEGRRPSESFDSAWYLTRYPDVKAAGMNPLLHFLRHGYGEARLPQALKSALLNDQLWAGAEATALPALEKQLETPGISDQEIACAAWSLGRWYAWRGDWHAVARVLRRYRALAQPVPGHLAPRLLDIDAEIRTGALETAQCLLDDLLQQHPNHPDLCLLQSNLMLAQEPQNEAASTTQQRLAWINRPYLARDLEPVRVSSDHTQAPEGLTLDGIDCAPIATNRQQPLKLAAPLVSVIVPVWNAANTLATALESLARQTWPALEIIVVDDHSSDDTAALAEAFAIRDSRFRLLRQTSNQGSYAARNLGLSAARGAFITTHDSDDWSHPRKIESQVTALLDSPDLVATVSHWVRTTTDMRFGQWSTPSGWMGWVHRNVSSLLFRRTVFEELGFWDRVTVNADTEYYYRIIHAYGADSIREVYPGLPLSFARHAPNSLTQRAETNLKSVFSGMHKDYQEAARLWHEQARRPSDLYLPAHPGQRPFPAQGKMCPNGDPTAPHIPPLPLARRAEDILSPLPHTLLFVHIPKTAGTSFRKAAVEYFGKEAIQCDYGLDTDTTPLIRTWSYDQEDFFQLASQFEQTGCRLICGHVPIGRYAPLVSILNTLSFVRHPVDQVISHFEHHRRRFGYKDTLEAFVAHPGNQNRQSRLLAGVPLEAIGFIGLTDRYEESLALLNQTFETGFSVLTLNINPRKAEVANYRLDPEIERRILETNRSDSVLVERIASLLKARLTAQASGHAFVHGAIQAVKAKTISGFAFTRQRTPVMVRLDINEVPVATVSATTQRPGLRNLGAPRQGCVGFDFHLDTPLAPNDCIQCVAVPSGQCLGTQVWQAPASKP